MIQKSKAIALAGLLTALVVGAAAIGARPEGNNTCPGIAKGCDNNVVCPGPVPSVCGTTAATTSADEKCCCKPDKPCDNCPCGKESEACGSPSGCGYCPSAAYSGPASCPSACTPQMAPSMQAYCGPPMYPTHPGMPEGHFPWSPPPGPHNFPGPMPFTIPPPPTVPFCSIAPSQIGPKCYVVEMKLMEQHEDNKPTIVAVPKLCVVEHEPAQVSAGTSHASLWEVGVPANEMGHEGYQVNVLVVTEKVGHVRLSCGLWISALENDSVLRESRSQTTQVVALDKTVKVNCDRTCSGECVRCWLELTVKELPADEQKAAAWVAPAPRPLCCQSEAGGGVRVPVSKTEAVFFDKGGKCCPVQKKQTATGVKMHFTTVETPEHFVVTEAEGKMRDLQHANKLLEVSCCGDTKMTCAKMELKHTGSNPVMVSVRDGQVYLEGEGLKAFADKVTTEGGSVVTLEGHVRVDSSSGKVQMKSGKVRIETEEIIKTGVISCPGLIQD